MMMTMMVIMMKFVLVCKVLMPYYFELKKISNCRRTPLFKRDPEEKLPLF